MNNTDKIIQLYVDDNLVPYLTDLLEYQEYSSYSSRSKTEIGLISQILAEIYGWCD